MDRAKHHGKARLWHGLSLHPHAIDPRSELLELNPGLVTEVAENVFDYQTVGRLLFEQLTTATHD
jgi:hypothetical protein